VVVMMLPGFGYWGLFSPTLRKVREGWGTQFFGDLSVDEHGLYGFADFCAHFGC